MLDKKALIARLLALPAKKRAQVLKDLAKKNIHLNLEATGFQGEDIKSPESQAPGAKRAPLTPAQYQVWLHEQKAPGGSAYHIALTWQIKGALDVQRMQAALDALVRRHQSLRLAIKCDEGETWQEDQENASLQLAQISVPEHALEASVTRLARAPFDLSRPPLLRARLLVHEDAPDSGSHSTFALCLASFDC